MTKQHLRRLRFEVNDLKQQAIRERQEIRSVASVLYQRYNGLAELWFQRTPISW